MASGKGHSQRRRWDRLRVAVQLLLWGQIRCVLVIILIVQSADHLMVSSHRCFSHLSAAQLTCWLQTMQSEGHWWVNVRVRGQRSAFPFRWVEWVNTGWWTHLICLSQEEDEESSSSFCSGRCVDAASFGDKHRDDGSVYEVIKFVLWQTDLLLCVCVCKQSSTTHQISRTISVFLHVAVSYYLYTLLWESPCRGLREKDEAQAEC